MAIDSAPMWNFGHYDVLILQYIRHRMRHVSALRSVTSTGNIKLTYVTSNMFKIILVPMLSTLRHSFVLVFMLDGGHSIAGCLLQVFYLRKKSVISNTSSYICYNREQH